MTADFKYQAFISYSHRDTASARRLQRALESFRVPSELQKPGGVERIFPVFLDREELAASPNLSERIQSALAASRTLIVVCSPASADSRYVDQEIQMFREQAPDRLILSLIVEGNPPDCFPPALRFETQSDGALSPLPEPLAADARPTGDGRRRAHLMLVAALLGVEYDQLLQREVRRRRRLVIGYGLVAAACCTLIAVLIAWGLQSRRESARSTARASRAEAQLRTSKSEVERTKKEVAKAQTKAGLQQARADREAETASQRLAAQLNLEAIDAIDRGDIRGARAALMKYPADQKDFEWRLLISRLDQSTRTLVGHEGPVFDVAAAPDAPRLYSAGSDGIRVWDSVTGRQLKHLELKFYPYSLAAGYAGQLAVGLSNGTARWLDAENGKTLYEFRISRNPIGFVDISPDGKLLCASSLGGYRRVFDLQRGRQKLHLTGVSQNAVWTGIDREGRWNVDTLFSHDGAYLISSIDIWNVKEGMSLTSPPSAQRLVLSGGRWRMVEVPGVRGAAAEDIQRFRMLTDGRRRAVPKVLAVAKSRPLLALGQRELKVFDFKDKAKLLWKKDLSAAIHALAISLDGALVAAATDDQRIQVWKTAGGDPVRTVVGHRDRLERLVFDKAGRLISCSRDGSLKIWPVGSPHRAPRGRYVVLRRGAELFSMAPDFSRSLRGRPPEDVQPRWRILDVEFVDEDTLVATAHYDLPKDIKPSAINVQERRELIRLETGEVKQHSLQIRQSPMNGRYGLSPAEFTLDSNPALVSLLRVSTLDEQREIHVRRHSGKGAEASSSATDFRFLHILAKNGELLHVLAGHGDDVLSLAAHPDNHRVASGARDGTVRIWNHRTGALLLTLKLGTEPVLDIDFSPRGHCLAAVTPSAVHVWRTKDAGRQTQRIRLPYFAPGQRENEQILDVSNRQQLEKHLGEFVTIRGRIVSVAVGAQLIESLRPALEGDGGLRPSDFRTSSLPKRIERLWKESGHTPENDLMALTAKAARDTGLIFQFGPPTEPGLVVIVPGRIDYRRDRQKKKPVRPEIALDPNDYQARVVWVRGKLEQMGERYFLRVMPFSRLQRVDDLGAPLARGRASK